MLAPKCSTYNGRPTFANPRYLKKAQSEKPCLYEIPFDTSDPANRFAPDREETMTLDNESRSKLDKDTVKPYDYTRQNSLYEIFKGPSLEYLYQLERAKEVRKTMWRKPFVRTKPNIAKNVAFLPVSKSISKIKETHRELQGKSSVETQFNKPSVVRQPNAQRIPKPSVLGKPTPFSNSPEMRSFQTKQSVNKTNVSDGLFKQVTQQNLPQIRKQAVRNTNVIAPGPSRNCPKHVSHQSPREKVGSNDMVHNYYLEKAKGKCITLERQRKLASIIECSGFQTDVHLGAHRKQMAFIEVQGLACPTCKKLFYSANHDECVLNYLSRLNPRASTQNKDAKSHKTTKRYMPVEKLSTSKKPERLIPKGHRFSHKKTTTVPEKTRTPRSCLRWQPTGRILKTVCLRWVPTGKLLNSCTGKVDSEPAHGSIVDIPHIHACKQTLGLSAGTSFNGQKQQRIDLNADALHNEKQENLRVWLLKFLISKKPVPECSGLVLHQMTSDHNRSELGIQDHSNEQSSSKLVPKVVVRLGINPVIQPEPEDLPKDNPKLEIAVLRSPVLWAKIGESSLIGPELVQETTDKVVLIKEKLKTARDRQKSYADNRRKPLELGLPKELSEIKIDKTLHFVEEPVEIMDHEVKTLKRSKMSIFKVRWNSKRGPEFTWDHEDQMKAKHPQLFVANTG
ncbi:hypothetical protein Tco_0682405 [Tanacetum coccineum]|uniref:Reverse transcriptase domain-containing protein n=1 Tax=Tanacetum coccineum TaxID=301880 RepID=A0ABQ4XSN4_9ASTR